MPRRPRLLFVITLAEVGGAQSYVRDLLPAVREEFDVTVASHGEGPLRDAAVSLGIPFVPLRHVRRDLSPYRDTRGLLELVSLCRRVRPDIVHLNSSKAGILGRIAAALARVPVRIFTAHGWAFKGGHGWASAMYLWADRLVEPLTTTTICVSDTELRAGLAARTCRSARTVVILNAVDVGPPPRDGRPAREPVEVVSVGRLAEPKDFATLVEAVGRVRPGSVRLQIIGDGPHRAALEGQIARLDLADAVELVGEIDDVPARLRDADVFVLASRSEGMPISVLEAMAAGLPVVASDVGGIHEAVEDGITGILVPPGSVAELGAALDRLAADASLRERLGRAGRERAEERFGLAMWREEHVALYRRLLR